MTRAALGLAMLVAIGIAGAVLLNRTQLMEAVHGMAHTFQVSASIEATLGALRQMDRAARDYVVTDTENVHSKYTSARKEVRAELAELQLLTARSPRQQENMSRTEEAIERYLRYVDEALRVRRARGSSAAQRLLGDISTTPLADVLLAFEGIRAEESRALEDTKTALLRLDQATNLGLAAAFALMIVIQLSVLITSARDRRQTAAAQTALLRANERLENLVEERTAKLAAANREMASEIAQRRRAIDQASRLRAIIDRTNDFVGLADPNGNFIYLNAAGRRMTGYSERESIKGLSIAAFQPWVYDSIVSARQPVSPEGDLWAGESALNTRQGEQIAVSQVIIAHRGDNGRIEYLSTICRDISALKQSTLQAQNYARQLLQVQEQERRALALELHDQIGQQLAALKLNCATMQRELSDSPVGKRLGDCLDIIDATLSQTRSLAVNLRPSVLDNLGLVPALKWYANQQALRTDCAIDVSAHLPPEHLPAEVVTASFRIAQEAVNNALRHGRSGQIHITLAHEGTALVLEVRDDGAGFDAGRQIVARGDGSGIGLVGMRERAELLGGRFSIRSTVGGGAYVRAELPLSVPRV